MINTNFFDPEKKRLSLIEAISEQENKNYEVEDLQNWYQQNKAFVEEMMEKSGAILFRGFQVNTTSDFQLALEALKEGDLLSYIDGNSPRSKLEQSGIYTSTEYPSDAFISLHNEISYAAKWPEKLYFCCIVPPVKEGNTLLADCRNVLQDLKPEIVEEFEKRKVKYLRNLHGGHGFGPSWQNTFETNDRNWIEEFCRNSKIEFTWKDDDSLFLQQIGPGVITHPKTGEKVWFNQADQFHPSNHPQEIYEALMDLCDGDETRLPTYACFGDGDPIDPLMFQEIQNCFKKHTIYFPWKKGDFLVIDNMLVAHGRAPFSGLRKIVVAMS